VRVLLLDAILWFLASPILFLRWCLRARRWVRFWRSAYSTEVGCVHCKARISLVGMWRCGCGYTYAGHLLRHCPICKSLPRVARCFTCGASRLLPEKL
jgi:hypothetical protein